MEGGREKEKEGECTHTHKEVEAAEVMVSGSLVDVGAERAGG